MNRTKEIPSSEWAQLLPALARKNPQVRIDVMGEGIGDQRLVRELPLERFEFEEKGSAQGSIEIEVMGDGDGESFTHQIESPRHLWVERSDDGSVSSVDIESADRVNTIIRFD